MRPNAAPAIERSGELEFLGQPDRAIEGDPGHHLRMREVPARAADFPDPFVRFLPERLEAADERFLQLPRGRVDRYPRPQGQVHRIHDFSVHVELSLVRGGVADPHG